MSIRLKLGLVISLAIVAATASASLVFLSLQYSSIRQAEEEKIALLKSNIANIVSESLLAGDPLMLLDYLHGLRRHSTEFLRFRIKLAGRWQTVGETTPHQIDPKLARIEIVQPPGNTKSDPLTVEVWLSRAVLAQSERRARAKLADNMLRAGGIVVFSGLLAGFLLGWTMTRRIVSIETALREIGAGRSHARVKVQGSDEVAHLAQGVNEMAGRLQELDELKKTFIASVTHELRSPLGVIESYVKALLANPDHLAPEDRANLSRVMSNVNRLGHFVTNLLDMAKIERGKLDYAPRFVHIGELVEDTVLFFQPKAADAKITLSCSADKNITLRADPDLVTHVLTNLLSNALKFTRPGGKINVDLKRALGGVECSVTDTGVGIPAESLARIFKPFERIRNPMRATGVGLGLVISKSIIDMHGGHIAAESQINQGSRFYFFLPDNPPPSTPAPRTTYI